MVFRDDECRIRRDNAPANFATIKHIASNLMRVERRLAPRDEGYRERVVTGVG